MITPQALAYHEGTLWVSSHDAHCFYGVNAQTWTVLEETVTADIPWAAVWAMGAIYLTSGEDDRYLRHYTPGLT